MYEDEAGRQHTLSRSKLNDVLNLSNPEDGLTRTPIESYGQGETAETIQHCDKDPGILLGFLDAFVDTESARQRNEQLREKLLENQTRIERLQLDVNTIPDTQRTKAHAEGQLKALKEKEANRIVELEEKLAKGRAFRDELNGHVNSLLRSAKQALSNAGIADLVLGMDGSSLVVGKEEFDALREVVEGFVSQLKDCADKVDTAATAVSQSIESHLSRWKSKEAETLEQIETIRKDLATRGVRLDIAFIRKVTKDVSDFGAKLKVLENKKTQLLVAQEERRALLHDRTVDKARIFHVRNAFADGLNKNLRATVSDFSICIKFREGTYSPELEDLLKTALNWRTSQVPRAKLIAARFSPLQLREIVRKGDALPLLEITDSEGNQVFRQEEAKGIVRVLKDNRTTLYAMERCAFEDCPELIVTKEVIGVDGKKKYQSRDFSRLSLGQQQALLLSIMLFSKSNCPLVIDQPEDNLDSEFVYKTFVKTLRTIKERRQVIIVTHNANIAVLGDAELILPLKSTSESARIMDRGSIDNPETNKLTCAILEGSDQAFKKSARRFTDIEIRSATLARSLAVNNVGICGVDLLVGLLDGMRLLDLTGLTIGLKDAQHCKVNGVSTPVNKPILHERILSKARVPWMTEKSGTDSVPSAKFSHEKGHKDAAIRPSLAYTLRITMRGHT